MVQTEKSNEARMDSSILMPISRQQTSLPDSMRESEPQTPVPPEQQPKEVIVNEYQRQPGVEHTAPGMLNSGENAREEDTDDDPGPESTWCLEHIDDDLNPNPNLIGA